MELVCRFQTGRPECTGSIDKNNQSGVSTSLRYIEVIQLITKFFSPFSVPILEKCLTISFIQCVRDINLSQVDTPVTNYAGY